jgi:chemotaxis protein methyltransferase CheR
LFRELTDLVLPALNRRQPKINLLNIWSAGCSDGREPYSVAMAVEKWLLENPGAAFQNYRIRASDLNSEYLTVARQGIYTLKKKERSLLQLYGGCFDLLSPDRILIAPRLTSRVSFYNEDITLAAHNQRFQIIICTNVLMYYEKDFRKSIIGGLIETLDRDGFLFIESAGTKSMKELGLIRLSPASHFFQKTEQLFKEQGVK